VFGQSLLVLWALVGLIKKQLKEVDGRARMGIVQSAISLKTKSRGIL
jgi:hypothetical protein